MQHPTTTAEQLRAKILTTGYPDPGTINLDGEIHRFGVDQVCWFVGWDDGRPYVIVDDWSEKLPRIEWKGESPEELSPDQLKECRRKAAEAKRKAKSEREKQYQAASEEVRKIWASVKPADPQHPYLQKKQVQPHNLRHGGDNLLLPIFYRKELCSLQYISSDGAKKFHPGGRTGGSYSGIGTSKGSPVILIAEGWATSATLHEATGYPVVIGLNAGNLLSVAQQVRKNNPTATILICADDDHKTNQNPGLTKATEAAEAVKGLLAVPDFGSDRPKRATDFNDLAVLQGAEVVRQQITSMLKQHKTTERKLIWTTRELMSTDFPEPKWVVPGIIPGGYSLFVGATKLGKSWMALSIVTGVSSGGYVLGKIKVDPGPTLYLALEDTARRLKSRLDKIGAKPTDTCQIVLTWPRDEPVAKLRSWLEKNPETRLCIIDTLGRFAHIEDGNDYHQVTNFISELKAVADETDTAIITVHHTRKMETSDFVSSVLGSQAFAAAADTTLVLKRDRMSKQARLSITGRDVEENEYVLDFDSAIGTWTLKGDAADVQRTAERQIIFDILRASGPMTPRDMHRRLQETGDPRTESAIKKLMWSMSKEGVLVSMSGLYHLSDVKEPVTPVTSVTHGNQGNRSNPDCEISVTGLPGLPVTPGVTSNSDNPNSPELEIF